jgi:hypothetical protein
VQTPDGGFIVETTTNVSSTTIAASVVKVDSTGGLVWQEAFAGTGNSTATSIDLTNDGGFIVAGGNLAGLAVSGNPIFPSALVVRLDSMGNLVWQKAYKGLIAAVALSITQNSDGGYLVAGAAFLPSSPSNAWLLRLDSSGVIVWQATYAGGGSALFSAGQTSDGGFVAAGDTNTPDALVLRLDSNGVPVWQKTYHGINGTIALSIGQTSDGGFIVAGANGLTGNSPTASVLRLDSTGGIIWQRAFNAPSLAFSTQQTSDRGFAVAGFAVTTTPPAAGALVFKLNAKGEIHPCKDLSKASLVASNLFTPAMSITSTAVDITSPPIATMFTSVDTGAASMVLCHHGFKP